MKVSRLSGLHELIKLTNTCAKGTFGITCNTWICITWFWFLSQDLEQAVLLLTAADKTIRDISGKIAKIIRWEILYSHLLLSKTERDKTTISDIDKKVKSCLHSLKVDSGVCQIKFDLIPWTWISFFKSLELLPLVL